ncbi:MAG: NifU family protein, partial [Dissulfurimicrobium sp.]
MKEKVKAAMDKVRPMLQRDGGDVELVEIDEA